LEDKVDKLFYDFPVPAHGVDHIKRVTDWAVLIAKDEGYDEFLAKVAGFLHDIGRVAEFDNNPEKLRHHELSYILAKEWFREFNEFDILAEAEKEEILYAIRYHWDDTAENYLLANILRDADKLDMYGEIGVKRAQEFHKGFLDARQNIERNLALAENIKTKLAKKIIEENNLLEPLKKYLES
jgi:HD superfamily phosphodiesterase